MKSMPVVCALAAIAIALAACGRDEAPKPAATSAATKAEETTSHEHGGLPGLADALKADEKKEEAKPMPPAAPTAAPAEGVKK